MAIKEKKSEKISQAPRAKKLKSIRIKLVRSLIGYAKSQRNVARGLGLRKLNSEVIRPETAEILGMIRKISHLVKVEDLEGK